MDKGIFGNEVGSIYRIDNCLPITQLFAIKTDKEKLEEDLYAKSWHLHVAPFLVTWFQKTFNDNKRWLELQLGQGMKFDSTIEINNENKVYEHPLYPFMKAEIEWTITLKTDDGAHTIRGIFLCKTPHYTESDNWGWNKVPPEVALQARHEMAVTNLDFTIVVCDVGNNESDYCAAVIVRDENQEKDLINTELNFWNNHILTNTPPQNTNDAEADDFLASNIKEAIKKGKIPAQLKEVSNDLIEAARDFTDAHKKAKIMEKKHKEFASVMKRNQTALLEAIAANGQFAVPVSISTKRRRLLDSERFRKEKPDLSAKYSKKSPVVHFNVEIDELKE